MNTDIQKTSPDELVEAEGTEHTVLQPPVDILESEDDFIVVADMPGLVTEGIGVRLDREMLVIEGSSDIPGLEPARYRRTFRVMRGLDPDSVSADYSNGVLTVKLAKPATHKPRKIEVTAG